MCLGTTTAVAMMIKFAFLESNKVNARFTTHYDVHKAGRQYGRMAVPLSLSRRKLEELKRRTNKHET